MAVTLDENGLRSILQAPDMIQDPFKVLKAVSEFANDQANEVVGREMVLRALGRRSDFAFGVEILDSLARAMGLFPYANPEALDLGDRIAYEVHRPDNMAPDFVFHREQAEIYHRLLAGENLILSAPTSFGKSRIIDAIIATEKFANIAVIVPTLALIDETRRRLASFGNRYKVISHLSQLPSERNIFVLTAERAVAYEGLPKIDFFVIDEFYKLDGTDDDDQSRTIALNEAFYRLRRDGGQFYLLGPNIEKIPEGLEAAFRCTFHQTTFATVVIETVRAPGKGDNIARLIAYAKDIKEPTLIFCSSPPRANEVAKALIDAGVGDSRLAMNDAASWIGSRYHHDWILARGLRHGIGIHHGKIPRSLAQFVIRSFDEKKIRFLVCTSTLIEGVNTRAKNILIWDQKIAKTPLDFFSYNNIKGRSGRMLQHFVGRVVIFEDPPKEDSRFVDFPLFTQGETTPSSLLIQMENKDLTLTSVARVKKYSEKPVLSLATMQQNKSIDPDKQIELAEHIRDERRVLYQNLLWNRFPNWEQLKVVCELIWTFFVTKSRNGVYTSPQLAKKASDLKKERSTAKRIRAELAPGEFQAKSVDEAVERVLQFERNWAGFDLPQYLMALSRIQSEVFSKYNRPGGDYSFYAGKLQSLFRAPVIATLEEYGIPISVAEKLQPHLGTEDELDVALANLKKLDLSDVKLTAFEKKMVRYAQEAL